MAFGPLFSEWMLHTPSVGANGWQVSIELPRLEGHKLLGFLFVPFSFWYLIVNLAGFARVLDVLAPSHCFWRSGRSTASDPWKLWQSLWSCHCSSEGSRRNSFSNFERGCSVGCNIRFQKSRVSQEVFQNWSDFRFRKYVHLKLPRPISLLQNPALSRLDWICLDFPPSLHFSRCNYFFQEFPHWNVFVIVEEMCRKTEQLKNNPDALEKLKRAKICTRHWDLHFGKGRVVFWNVFGSLVG